MTKEWKWLFILIPAFFAVFQIFFAIYHYPLLGDDSIAFLPAAINFADGNGLTNSTYNITRVLNVGQAEVAYVNYPPIFPLVHGYLLFITGNLHANAAIIHIFLMALFSFIVFRLNKSHDLPKGQLALLLFFFLAAWNTQLNTGEGRPETLAQIWILLLIYTLFVSKNSYIHIVSGFLIGITGFTHPVGGIYAGLICLLVFLFSNYGWEKYFQIIIGGLASLVVLVIIYPFPITRLIKGITEHGRIVADRSLHSLQSFFYYHFTSPYVSFFFLLFLAGATGGLLFLYTNWKAIRFKRVFFFLLIVFVFVLTYFTFQTMEASYNLYVLLPFFGLGIFYLAAHLKSDTGYLLLLLVLLVSATGFARRAILFGFHIKTGLNFDSARTKVGAFLQNREKIAVSASFYTIPQNISLVTDDRDDPEVEYFLLQQNFTGLSVPPEISGFEIIDNQFSTEAVQLAGWKLASSVPGYQYALYQRRGN